MQNSLSTWVGRKRQPRSRCIRMDGTTSRSGSAEPIRRVLSDAIRRGIGRVATARIRHTNYEQQHLVLGRPLDVIEDEDLDGTFGRFEFKSELFLQSGKD